jgi:hypothetical protein
MRLAANPAGHEFDSANSEGVVPLEMANWLSGLRLTGPAVFQHAVFPLVMPKYWEQRKLRFDRAIRFLLRLSRLAVLAFYQVPHKRSWADIQRIRVRE